MRILLIPFSFIYYLFAAARDFLYNRGFFKTYSLGAKVISVGNITWGGTGKTPAVLSIAEMLNNEGHKVAVLTRGYGKDEQDLLLKAIGMTMPVVIGRDRVKSGKKAIERYSPDTLLLDDGFQHRRLKRDLDIVCIDTADPFGNRCLIPAGSMREGLAGLKRADVFLLTKVDLVRRRDAAGELEKRLRRINPDALIVKAIHSPKYFYKLSGEQLVDVEAIRNKNLALVSAIGSPRSFEKTILNMGLKPKRHFIFRDHHHYKDKDLKKIENYCIRNEIGTVITTEKDAVKLKAAICQISDVSFLALCIDLRIIENEQGFRNRLFGIYNG